MCGAAKRRETLRLSIPPDLQSGRPVSSRTDNHDVIAPPTETRKQLPGGIEEIISTTLGAILPVT